MHQVMSMRGVLGIVLLLALAWALGERRRSTRERRIPWRTVIVGIGLQAMLAVLLMRFAPASNVFLLLNKAALALQQATDHGTAFVFGYLGGGALPFVETAPGASFILAFKVLPLVLTISALSALLYYCGILQAVTRAFAWVLRRSMGVSGALALGAAVHVYVGMIEAPLLIRPYLARMQRGELFAVMSCGVAGVAGTVMVIYATMLSPVIPDALGNIVICSVISTPAALAVAALMVPFQPGEDRAEITVGEEPTGAFDALVKGTRGGRAAGRHRHRADCRCGPGGVGQYGARPVAGRNYFAKAVRASVPPGNVADRGSLGRERRGSGVDGHQDGAERVCRLCRFREIARGDAGAAVPTDRCLCALRLCEFRLAWHSGRRDGGDGTRTPPRDHRARLAFDPLRHDRHLHERRHRRAAGAMKLVLLDKIAGPVKAIPS
jgi:Na+ dependent nucleoside transporter N-terminus